MVLALWDRAKLAEDSGVEDGGGWTIREDGSVELPD
jgi:hypothetical protein